LVLFLKKTWQYAVLLVLGAAVFGIIQFVMGHEIAVGIFIGGEKIAAVNDMTVIDDVLCELNENVTSLEGAEIGGELRYRLVNVAPGQVEDSCELKQILSAHVFNNMTEAYALYISGELIAAAADAETVYNALDLLQLLKLDSVSEDTAVSGIGFLNDVSVCYVLCPKNELKSMEQIALAVDPTVRVDALYASGQLLQASATDMDRGEGIFQPVLRETADGDGTDSIDLALKKEIETDGEEETVSFSVTANRYLSAKTEDTPTVQKISTGDENLLYDYGVSRMPVKKTQEAAVDYVVIVNETCDETVERTIRYVDSEYYYEGTEIVTQIGKNGSSRVTYDVYYVGDEEISREVAAVQILEEPLERVIVRGIKEIPPAVPTGEFAWPCDSRYITSSYGSRSLFGKADYHIGTDISADIGENVYAADGGKVISAGYSRSYGYHILISHGNVYSTLYAHLSEILVEEGDNVYIGQTIAKSGNTGVTTGPHLHFEIRKYGTTVDAVKYLP